MFASKQNTALRVGIGVAMMDFNFGMTGDVF